MYDGTLRNDVQDNRVVSVIEEAGCAVNTIPSSHQKFLRAIKYSYIEVDTFESCICGKFPQKIRCRRASTEGINFAIRWPLIGLQPDPDRQ